MVRSHIGEKNRALEDMVNAMFLSPGLSHGMWGKAIISATYLLDKIPCKENKIVLMNYGRKEDYLIIVLMEIGKSSRIDDKVVQDQRQRDDYDLQDERQDQPKEEELVDLLSGCKPLGYKWIFKKKRKADGTVDKYKARLVIKGFRQREGLDYFDTYSLVTRITSIRMILAIAALRNLEVHQIDVKKAFLNGDLEEEIYMNQPEGFMAPGLESKVCRLVKSLYDLRKAPKQGHQISPYHQACHVGLYHSSLDVVPGEQYGELSLRENRLGLFVFDLNKLFPGIKHLLLAPSEFIENPAQGSKAPLTLSWERIPRLDSGVRASDPVGFPCISAQDKADITGIRPYP
ncbi:calcineurin B-like protein 4 [Tanacetum coccineum]